MVKRRAGFDVKRLALVIVAAHLLVSILHGAAHSMLGVRLSTIQVWYVGLVITVAPLVAGLLLLLRRSLMETAAALLVISMTGALLFGAYSHFVAVSPDHILHLPGAAREGWATVFRVTAVLLAITEALGVWAGVHLLLEKQKAG